MKKIFLSALFLMGSLVLPVFSEAVDALSQYGITWQFDRKVETGKFITGDYYVIGPVTIKAVSPAPAGTGKTFRNGSMLNPPVTAFSGYDGRFTNCFKENLTAKYPLNMKPGDSLISTVSLKELQQNQIIPDVGKRNIEDTPLKTAAILTCLAELPPADAFRPAYCDEKKGKFRTASEIRWELLPKYPAIGKVPKFEYLERAFERPWIDHVYGWESRELHPSENMPGYGRELARIVSIAGLMMCSDFTTEQKQKICYGLIQVGLDNWAIARRGKKGEAGGWPAAGGYGNGRKFPIVFAAVLLNDKEMLNQKENIREASFDEDEHTIWGKSWTGAKVVFAGQYPLVGDKIKDRGPYEHLQPKDWPGPKKTQSESYRRCCTSLSWVGEALAAKMLKAESVWAHEPFFAYVDRWMTEEDTSQLKVIKESLGSDMGIRQGEVFDPWVKEMWKKYREDFKPSAAVTWK